MRSVRSKQVTRVEHKQVARMESITEAVLILEFAVIVFLIWAASLDYRANQYLQAWAKENAPFLGYLLSGYLAAMLTGVLIGSIALFVQDKGKRRKGKRGKGNREKGKRPPGTRMGVTDQNIS